METTSDSNSLMARHTQSALQDIRDAAEHLKTLIGAKYRKVLLHLGDHTKWIQQALQNVVEVIDVSTDQDAGLTSAQLGEMSRYSSLRHALSGAIEDVCAFHTFLAEDRQINLINAKERREWARENVDDTTKAIDSFFDQEQEQMEATWSQTPDTADSIKENKESRAAHLGQLKGLFGEAVARFKKTEFEGMHDSQRCAPGRGYWLDDGTHQGVARLIEAAQYIPGSVDGNLQRKYEGSTQNTETLLASSDTQQIHKDCHTAVSEAIDHVCASFTACKSKSLAHDPDCFADFVSFTLRVKKQYLLKSFTPEATASSFSLKAWAACTGDLMTLTDQVLQAWCECQRIFRYHPHPVFCNPSTCPQ